VVDLERNYTIYILLSHSGSIFSKAIKTYTRKSYTHVSIALDRGLVELYSFGRLRPNNPILAGFVKEDIVNGTYGRFPKTKCILYSLEVSGKQYRNLIVELNKFKLEPFKYKYNLVGVIGAMFNYPIQRRYSYFCSQFVSEILDNSEIKILNKDPRLTAPMDFTKCKDLNLIYEGDLNTYRMSMGGELVKSY